MQLIYPGPSQAVMSNGIHAERGVPVEITGEHAQALLLQGWTRHDPPKSKDEDS